MDLDTSHIMPYVIVAHLMAELEGENEIATGFTNYDEITEYVKAVVDNWNDNEDTMSVSISEYANKEIREQFWKSGDDDE